MNIGEAAQRTGLSAKTIRYYESVDLIDVARDGNGYRNFSDSDVQQLVFIRRLRSLGFTLTDCNMLVPTLERARAEGSKDRCDTHSAAIDHPAASTPGTANADARNLLIEKLVDIDSKLKELQAVRASIQKSIHDVKSNTNASEFIRLLNRTI